MNSPMGLNQSATEKDLFHTDAEENTKVCNQQSSAQKLHKLDDWADADNLGDDKDEVDSE